MEEIFKDAVGYEKYFQISNFGRVFSKRSNRLLKPTKLKSGYMVINTRLNGREGEALSLRIHRLVAETFLEAPDKLLVLKCSNEHYGKVLVRHLDGNKTNNSVGNLAWGDSKTNSLDYHSSEKSKEAYAKLRVSRKLDSTTCEFIVKNYKPRDKIFGCRALARKFGVSHVTILGVLNRHSTA